MQNNLLKFFNDLRNIGILPNQNQLEQERIRLLNDTVLIGMSIETIFLLTQVAVFDFSETLVSLARLVLTDFILVLHYYQKIKIARLGFMLPIPIVVMKSV